MYLSSNTPLMVDTQACAVKNAQAALARQLCIQQKIAEGRAAIFNDIISPDQVAAALGIPAGISAANMQAQTLGARKAAWLYGDGSVPDSTQPQLTSPNVYPMNRAGGCAPRQMRPAPVSIPQPFGPPKPLPTPPPVTPTVLPQAPIPVTVEPALPDMEIYPPPPVRQNITYNGRPVAVPGLPIGRYYGALPRGAGLTGYAPPWSDAFVQPSANGSGGSDTGVMGWIQSHPWLSLAIAGAGAFAMSKGGRR